MHFAITIALLAIVLHAVEVHATGPYKSLGDLFEGQLANLSDHGPDDTDLGGQDFFYCCNLAVNRSLEIVDGDVQFKPSQTFLVGNISSFMSYQYPCTAAYNGSDNGPAQVTIPYSWCRDNCNGWRKTSVDRQSDWIQPLVAFIVPTVVFCFSIPRRRSLGIPESVSPDTSLFTFPGNLTMLYKLPLAALIVLLDAVQWLVACIVMAGPMLLAGIFEAVLDARIMNYLRSSSHLSPRRKAHLLLIVLIGNLDEHPAWEHSKRVLSSLEDGIDGSEKEVIQDVDPAEEPKEALKDEPSEASPGKLKFPEQGRHSPVAFRIVKRQLTSLLESQTAFGTAVGIGVFFFASSFFYSITEIKNNFGDAGTSHSLAFGCFWMVIGHVAVVAGVLLANPNSSAWEGVAAEAEDGLVEVSGRQHRHRSSSIAAHVRRWSETSFQERRLILPSSFKIVLYRPDFSTRYKSVWMWNRGISKAMWVARYAEEYDDPNVHTKIIPMKWTQLILAVAVPALLLFIIPAFLGGMTSYSTPTVGLSCRSMVPLVFMNSQLLLVVVWVCDWKLWLTTRDGKILTMERAKEIRQQRLSVPDIMWYTIFFLAIAGSVVSAIGGTMFHLMGLFLNCLCWTSIYYWADRNSPNTTLTLGLNFDEQIFYAQRFWIPIGISATLFLVFTAYLGWQYQRSLRMQFRKLVLSIDRS